MNQELALFPRCKTVHNMTGIKLGRLSKSRIRWNPLESAAPSECSRNGRISSVSGFNRHSRCESWHQSDCHSNQPCRLEDGRVRRDLLVIPAKSCTERTINNEFFVNNYAPARERAFTKRNITSGWATSSLLPFNPDRTLRVTPKPPPTYQETDSRINGIQADCSQNEILQSPVTPVSAEAFVSLYNQIEQNIHIETGTSRLEKRVQKLANPINSCGMCPLAISKSAFEKTKQAI